MTFDDVLAAARGLTPREKEKLIGEIEDELEDAAPPEDEEMDENRKRALAEFYAVLEAARRANGPGS